MSAVLLFALAFLTIVYNAVASFTLFFIPRRFRRRKDIRGQRVLITGAGSGVGRQLAVEFSKHATCLILVDINRQSLLQTEKMLDHQSTAFTYECDVSDYKKVYEMARKVKEEAGDVDILVNNAGIVSGKYLLDLPEEKIIKTIGVNALAHFWTCKAFLPAMMKRSRGHLVCIASVMAKFGGPKVTDYCASKSAAVGLAESLEVELREQNLDGIKVTIVCPSHVDTGLFQGAKLNTGPLMTAKYVAKEILLGVLEEQELIFLPHWFKYGPMIKEFLPRWLIIKLGKFTADIKAMENFTGRRPDTPPETDWVQ